MPGPAITSRTGQSTLLHIRPSLSISGLGYVVRCAHAGGFKEEEERGTGEDNEPRRHLDAAPDLEVDVGLSYALRGCLRWEGVCQLPPWNMRSCLVQQHMSLEGMGLRVGASYLECRIYGGLTGPHERERREEAAAGRETGGILSVNPLLGDKPGPAANVSNRKPWTRQSTET